LQRNKIKDSVPASLGKSVTQ